MIDNQKPITSNRYNSTKQCRYGLMLFNTNDRYVGRSLDLYGEFSEGEVDIFRQVLRPGMVACDVGANIGAHTVFMSKAVGPDGVVLAFEPQRIVFQNLCANLALNALENVHTFHGAVGDTASEIRVPSIRYDEIGNFGGLSLGMHDEGERVSLKTIDGLPFNSCHFIKIDVEGMELSVLKGATATLKKFRPILYVENDRQAKSQQLIEFLLALDYRLYWHCPPLFNPNNYFENSTNVFEGLVSMNMLCLPDESRVNVEHMERIASSEN